MRFLDTSSKDSKDTLAMWFREVTKEGVCAIGIQSGYFTAGVLDFLVNALSAEVLATCEIQIVIGTNDPRTYGGDVEALLQTLCLPRKNARLGVVGFSDGLFHPKCYVVTRTDGSMAAYVGSANFTSSGLAKNIEAGIALDTREDGSHAICDQIAQSIEKWHTRNTLDGFYLINSKEEVQALVTQGILSAMPLPPRGALPPATGTPGDSTSPLPQLKPLVKWPKYPGSMAATATVLAPLPVHAGSAIVSPKSGAHAFGRVLVAEITSGRLGGTTRQIDLKKEIADVYFGGVSANLTCAQVSLDGTMENFEKRVIGTKSSANYYVELSGLTGPLKPEYRDRPLLLMVQYTNDTSQYLYFWLHPTDPNFSLVYNYFITPKEVTRKGTHSIKLIDLYTTLVSLWPDNPFALALAKAGK